jgi:hypothetical protein
MRGAWSIACSPTDVLNGLAIAVEALRDARDAACSFLVLQRSLDAVARRVAQVRLWGGRVEGLDDASAWLRTTIAGSPALSEPAAGGLREDLLRLVDRVRGDG